MAQVTYEAPGRVLIENVKYSYPDLSGLGVDYYGGRAFAYSYSKDIVILPHCCKSDVDLVLAHYRRCGLGVSENFHFSDSPETEFNFADFGGRQLHPFIMNESLAAWSGETCWHEAVELADDKNWTIRLFQKLGVSCPDTICFDEGIDARTVPIVFGERRFKPARGATNKGQITIANSTDLLNKVDGAELRKPFQLQEPIDVMYEGSVQFDPGLGGFCIVGQYVGPKGHEGNFFPPPSLAFHDGLVDEAHDINQSLTRYGLGGYRGIDFLIDRGGRHYFTEINPRNTGCKGPYHVANRFGSSSWVNRLVPVAAESLADLDLSTSRLTFDRSRGDGVVLTNPFTLQPGVQKLGVQILAPSHTRMLELIHSTADWLQAPELRKCLAA